MTHLGQIHDKDWLSSRHEELCSLLATEPTGRRVLRAEKRSIEATWQAHPELDSRREDEDASALEFNTGGSVSYTHLTLPTQA